MDPVKSIQVPGRMSPIPSESETSNSVSPQVQRTRLRRTASHTSMISISGMDIHSTFPETIGRSPQHRPSPLVLPSAAGIAAISGSPSKFGPVLTTTSAQFSTNRSKDGASWKTLRSTLEAVPEHKSKDKYTPLTDTFGGRLGGWFSGRWTSSANPPSSAGSKTPAISETTTPILPQRSASDSLSIMSASSQASVPKKDDPTQLREVSDGQSGAVMTEPLDSDALQECLEENLRRSLELKA